MPNLGQNLQKATIGHTTVIKISSDDTWMSTAAKVFGFFFFFKFMFPLTPPIEQLKENTALSQSSWKLQSVELSVFHIC